MTEQTKFTFTFTESEINTILQCLGVARYQDVFALVNSIQIQAKQQLENPTAE